MKRNMNITWPSPHERGNVKCHSSFGLMRVIKEYIVCNNYTTTRISFHIYMDAHTFCASHIISEIKRRSRCIMYTGFIGFKTIWEKRKTIHCKAILFLRTKLYVSMYIDLQHRTQDIYEVLFENIKFIFLLFGLCVKNFDYSYFMLWYLF